MGGRQIIDSILIANECVDSPSEESGSCVICKLYVEKAYYHVNFFLISKKRILLVKEKQKKHKEFTVVNNGKKKQQDKTAPNLF